MNNLSSLFAAPPAPIDLSSADLATLFAHADELARTIPAVQLSADQRRRVNGYLMPRGPLLVFYLARALSHASAFPDFPGEGQRLADENQRANAWLCLRDLFQELSRRCDVQFQLQRATTVHRATTLLRRLRDALATLPELSQILLAPALRVLALWRHGLERAKRKKPQPS